MDQFEQVQFNNELQNQIADLEAALAASQREASHYQELAEDLEGQLEKANDRIEDLEDILKDVEREVGYLDNTLLDIRRAIDGR